MILKVLSHKAPFVIIDKTGLEDERLSWKAKGLLAYLLSRPENWTVVVRHLEGIGPDGRESVQKGLKELETNGYAAILPVYENGKILGRRWYVAETPAILDERVSRPSALPTVGKPAANKEGERIRNDERELPYAEELAEESSRRRDKEAAELYDLYPRRVGRGAAIKAIEKALRQHPFLQIRAAVAKYAEAMKGEPMEFIPHPSTWFNQERFLDDPRGWVRSAPRQEPRPSQQPVLRLKSAEEQRAERRQHAEQRGLF